MTVLAIKQHDFMTALRFVSHTMGEDLTRPALIGANLKFKVGYIEFASTTGATMSRCRLKVPNGSAVAPFTLSATHVKEALKMFPVRRGTTEYWILLEIRDGAFYLKSESGILERGLVDLPYPNTDLIQGDKLSAKPSSTFDVDSSHLATVAKSHAAFGYTKIQLPANVKDPLVFRSESKKYPLITNIESFLMRCVF